MGRTPGSARLSASLEVLAGAPLDAREKVATKADLTASGSFPYAYVGMETYVVSENKKYRLIGADPTVLANWEEVGSGSDIDIDNTPTQGSPNAVQSGGTYTALQAKADLVNGKIPVEQLPNGFDNIDEGTAGGVVQTASGYTATSFTITGESEPVTPESDVLYIDTTLNVSFRWTGTQYVSIGGGGVSLGETSSTAYRGDRGKTAYDFSQNPYTSTPAMNGTGSAGSSNNWARGDHVHPSDSSKADAFSLGDGLEQTGTTIGVKEMAQSDLGEIVSPRPSVMSRRFKYSTDEQVVGEWIDGKPIYQKTIQTTMPESSTNSVIAEKFVSIGAQIDTVVFYEAIMAFSSNGNVESFMSMGPINSANDLNGIKSKVMIFNNNSSTKNIVYILNSFSNWNNFTVYVTIRYTKTTD